MTSNRVEMRINMRLYGEVETVSDDEALIETRVIRHMNKLEDLSRDNLKSWIVGALRNQYLADKGLAGHTQPPIADSQVMQEPDSSKASVGDEKAEEGGGWGEAKPDDVDRFMI